jgi:phytoene dehydrogenase-like protein
MSGPALVVGSGANELVAAHLLARAGRKVVVVAQHPAALDTSGWIPPELLRKLGANGVRVERPDPWIAAPLPQGGHLELFHDMAKSTAAIRRISARDAEKWPLFCERMAKLAGFLGRVYMAPPPRPTSLGFALRLRATGRQTMEDLLRVLAIPAADLLDEWFESDALKGVLGAMAVMHLHQGPRAGGTAFGLLHRHVGSPPGVFRAPHSNAAEALRRRPGIESRAARVLRISVRAGRASAVVLDDGTEITAEHVVCGLDPRRTLLELTEPGWLEPDLVRAVRNVRCRGVAARVVLRLDRPAGFSRMAISPSLDYLERAYDDVKYGRVSREPFLEASAAGAEVHVHAQYVPYRAADRHALGERVVAMLKGELGAATVVEATVQLPEDLERAEGWPQGQPHHAELALDQVLWMRPTPELAGYRTPIEGLWLCGPAMHPGAGVVGASAYHCVNAVLRA